MKSRTKTQFFIAALLFIIFIIYTILVKIVDVSAIGPENSSVGFAGINEYFANMLGFNEKMYKISGILGIIPFAVVGLFAVLGLVQAIKRKSVLKVDKQIIALGVYYIIVAVLYVLFEIVAINYRPVILKEGLEASFPSTHTMVAVSVMGAAVIYIKNNFNKHINIQAVLISFSVAVGGAVAATRFMSGVHWFTDIMGGMLIGFALITAYSAVCNLIFDKNLK